jgi:hypothetical protein
MSMIRSACAGMIGTTRRQTSHGGAVSGRVQTYDLASIRIFKEIVHGITSPHPHTSPEGGEA